MSTTPLPGSLIADRFELLEEMPRVTDRRLYRARDLAFDQTVAVKLLGEDRGMDSPGRHSLSLAMRRVQNIPHPHLLRYDSLDPAAGVQVREWIHGLSLLDLLRRRRELSADDTFRLLSTLPATLDFLAANEIPIPRPLLGKVFIQFDLAAAPDALVAQRIADWPPFFVKVNPLSQRGILSELTDDTTRTQFIAPRSVTASPDPSGPLVLAELLYELLGGRQREAGSRRYSPISALREEGNGLLRRALLVAPHTDCHALWQDLRQAQGHDAPPGVPLSLNHQSPVRLEIVPPGSAALETGLEAVLTPEDAGVPAIRLIARPRLTIGRSLQTADFVTRLLPESPENIVFSERISRIHAVAEMVGGHLFIRDGNGSAPSVNGSRFDDALLSPDHPAPIRHRAVLGLAEEYDLELIPLLHPPPREWPAPHAADGPAREPAGAVVCAPGRGQPVTRHCVWLFSEIGFGTDFRGRIIWDTRTAGESPASFHFHRGAFWLRNHSLRATDLTIGSAALGRDQLAPLTSRTTVRLGGTNYSVAIH